jgi:hypothetical protein
MPRGRRWAINGVPGMVEVIHFVAMLVDNRCLSSTFKLTILEDRWSCKILGLIMYNVLSLSLVLRRVTLCGAGCMHAYPRCRALNGQDER